MQIKLVVVEGAASRGEVQLRLPAIIGRSKDANLTIGHPKVSRKHCELYEENGRVMVRDHGSLNGTVLEGNRVSQAAVPSGSRLTIGPLTFIALFETSSAVQEPSVPVIATDEDADSTAMPDFSPGPDTDAVGFDLSQDEGQPPAQHETLNPTEAWDRRDRSQQDEAGKSPDSALDMDDEDLGALGGDAPAPDQAAADAAAQTPHKPADRTPKHTPSPVAAAPQNKAAAPQPPDDEDEESSDDGALAAFLRDLGR